MRRVALALAITPALVLPGYAQQGALEQSAPAALPSPFAQREGQPSASNYAVLVLKKVKPLVVFPNQKDIQGNPAANVRVVVAADGKLIHKELVQTSGYPEWDAIALNAVERASPFPPPPGQLRIFTITFRPN